MTSVPDGYTTVAPWIVSADTGRLLEFITAVFDGAELARVPLEDSTIGHAEIRVGDMILLAFDRREGWPDMPSLLRVFVADADATIERAVTRVPASSLPPDSCVRPASADARDPFGNIWWISSSAEDVSPDEGMRRLGEPEYADAIARRPRDARPRAQRPRSGHRKPAGDVLNVSLPYPNDGQPSPTFPLYSRGNMGEAFPNVISPMSGSLMLEASERAQTRWFVETGAVSKKHVHDPANAMFVQFYGYLYGTRRSLASRPSALPGWESMRSTPNTAASVSCRRTALATAIEVFSRPCGWVDS